MDSRHEDDDLPSIDDFGERLEKSRRKDDAVEDLQRGERSALGQAFRIGTEMLAALLVAGAIGYGIDQLIGTKPWFMLGGLAIGFAAGILNVSRAMNEMNAALEEESKDE
ncbi:AtpZ/AtpI family protein [Parvularcula flava]|uniref:ATP synthase protein I n=1 Tax=Aquisalinus luteolus TaxID=1566827 RepID=A0A8J3A597_9PROT|nr:AtpZ/AtpI family protein [Aquisalinus luteolus]NHK28723.1 AtpZ/AtpI family protein [Aquisalinus luteolus]GGH99323.1 hypothetical protein GCM10011355_25010 [Aquisalinus luteolus]